MTLNVRCNITGIVLAGGKSRRIGKDKAFLPFPKKPLIEVVLDKLKPLFKQLIIVSNKPEQYKRYNLMAVKDVLLEHGALGGIYTGLLSSKTEYNFILACDMPFLKIDLVRYMLQKINGYDLLIAKYKGRLQPLCAVYSKNCISPIKEELLKKNLRLTDFSKNINPVRGKDFRSRCKASKGVKARIIEEAEIVKFDPRGISFININTLKEYRRFKNGCL